MGIVCGLTVGHGDLIGLDLLAELKRRGVVVVRLEAKPRQSLADVAALAAEVVEAGLQPDFIVTTPEQITVQPLGGLIEIGNEPDLERFGWTVASYVKCVEDCIPVLVLRDRKTRAYAGVVSNLNDRGLRFAKRLPWDRWPCDVISAAFHRYPERGGPHVAHPPSRTREEEIGRFRSIVGSGRPLACTEVGYNTAEFTEQEAADYLEWEREFMEDCGVELVCAYGINDGSDRRDTEQNFGMRRFDNTWKGEPGRAVLNAFTGVHA